MGGAGAPAIWTPDVALRYGSAAVMTRPRRVRQSISITCDLANRTQPAGCGPAAESTQHLPALLWPEAADKVRKIRLTVLQDIFGSKVRRLEGISIVSSEDRIILILKRQKHRDRTSSVARSCGFDLVDVTVGERHFQFALLLRNLEIETPKVVTDDGRLRTSLWRLP